jgi:hypothetical protein
MDLTAFFQALTSIFPFLPKIYNPVVIDYTTLFTVFCWLVAASISLYFSMNNSRIWTSIGIGFFLLFWSQSFQLNPWHETFTVMIAIHFTIGTISILLVSHGIQEYYLFTRTLEITGAKKTIYLGTALIILCSILVISLNPKPSLYVLRNYRMMNNTVWFFLCILNIYYISKIYMEMKDSPIAKGIICLGMVFVFALIWKGAGMYLNMYMWDKAWLDIIEFTGESTDIQAHMGKVKFARSLFQSFNFLTSLSVAGTFAYLFKLLR